MKALRLCLAVCLVLLCTSCALKPTWDVFGKWQKVDNSEVIEFSRNGTVTVSGGPVSLTAAYKFLNSKILQINMGSLGAYEVKIDVTQNSLTVIDAKGHETKFTRVK